MNKHVKTFCVIRIPYHTKFRKTIAVEKPLAVVSSRL